MTRTEQLAVIRRKCVEANHAIEKDWQVATILSYNSKHDAYNALAIKSRPIRLADVLLAISESQKKEAGRFRMYPNGYMCIADINDETVADGRWNLRTDDLEEQSDECVAFIHYHGYSGPCPKPPLDRERKLLLAKYVDRLLPETGNRLGDIILAMIDDLKSIDALVPRD